jgi:hypothetical protein
MLPKTIRSVILIYCHMKLMLIMNLWLYVVHGTMVRPYDTNSVKIFVLSVWFSQWNSTYGYKGRGTLDFYFAHIITYWHFKQSHRYMSVALYKNWVFFCLDCHLCIDVIFRVLCLWILKMNEQRRHTVGPSVCFTNETAGRRVMQFGIEILTENSHEFN